MRLWNLPRVALVGGSRTGVWPLTSEYKTQAPTLLHIYSLRVIAPTQLNSHSGGNEPCCTDERKEEEPCLSVNDIQAIVLRSQ